MPRRSIHVLLPTGSKEEVAEVRRALGGDDVDLHVGTASAHTPGQTLYGDVIVVGDRLAGGVERDATGKVQRYADMGALMASKQVARGSEVGGASTSTSGDARGEGETVAPSVGPAPGGAVVAQPPSPELPPEQPSGQPKPNGPPGSLPDLAALDRGQLLKLASERFPDAGGRWVTLGAPDIRKRIVELEAKRG